MSRVQSRAAGRNRALTFTDSPLLRKVGLIVKVPKGMEEMEPGAMKKLVKIVMKKKGAMNKGAMRKGAMK